MKSLENLLENVEFHKNTDTEMMPVPEDPPTPSSTIQPQLVSVAQSSNTAPRFLVPSVPSLVSNSTPASSTAVKRKTIDDDTSRQESRPPHSSKSGKSAGGSSKSQRTLPNALEELGGQVKSSIDTATAVLKEAIAGHEPPPIRK